MREIKFRAWNISIKHMFDWDDIWSDWNVCDLIGKQGDIPLQYTGLKDKNGKEIYEGDIVNLLPDGYIKIPAEVQITTRGVMLYRHDTGIRIYGADWCDLNAESSDATIIGNIYENPELRS